MLMACEIIAVFGKWYNIDEEGEKTRFADYFLKLREIGVSFGKEGAYNFFKKDDEEKFRKNYAKWLKWYIENVKEEELEETNKQISENNASGSPMNSVKRESNEKKEVVDDSKKAEEEEIKKKSEKNIEPEKVKDVPIIENAKKSAESKEEPKILKKYAEKEDKIL